MTGGTSLCPRLFKGLFAVVDKVGKSAFLKEPVLPFGCSRRPPQGQSLLVEVGEQNIHYFLLCFALRQPPRNRPVAFLIYDEDGRLVHRVSIFNS